MIAHLSYVICDRCGNPAEVANDAIGARIIAAREGYARYGSGRSSEDVCPKCKAGPMPSDDGNWQRWPCPTVRAISTHIDLRGPDDH